MDDLCSDASKVIPPLHWFQRGNSRCYDLHSAISQAAGEMRGVILPGRPAACRDTHVKAGLSHVGIVQKVSTRVNSLPDVGPNPTAHAMAAKLQH